MNNLADPPSWLDVMDAVFEAGADLAQAMQDTLDMFEESPDDTPGKAECCGHYRRLIDAWEQAYRLGLPPSDEEPE